MGQQKIPLIFDRELSAIVAPLLAWYDGHARVLPWREDPTPYRVYVSEIMLQQTRVEAVKPYFERFVAALPGFAELARVPEEQLLKLWEGLGYYNRARNLQRTARVVMEEYGGQMPSDAALLQKLPGVGEYTAGALASIAFSRPSAAVDGNVLRVMARLCGSRADIWDVSVKRQTSLGVQRLIPADRPGDFNQALMELGATVCLPNGVPLCEECPLKQLCEAYRSGTVQQLPVKKAKKSRAVEQLTVLVLFCDGKVVLRKRPEKGLLAGMWEFPHLPGRVAGEQVLEYLKGRAPVCGQPAALPEARHIFTHREWHMSGFAVELAAFEPPPKSKWVFTGKEQLTGEIALPSAFKVYTGCAMNILSGKALKA